MAKTLHIAGTAYTNYITTPNVTYGALFGYMDSDTGVAESNSQIPIDVAGVYSNFSVYLDGSNISQPCTVRLRKNGANANQYVTIPENLGGTFTDITNTDTVAAGDLVSVQYDLSAGTGDTDMVYVYATFDTNDSTNLTVSKFALSSPSGLAGLTTASGTYFFPLNGYWATGNTTEANAQFKAPCAGTLKNLSVKVLSNSRTTTTTVQLRKNTANGNQVVTFGSTETGLKKDTSNSDTVAAGDLINFSITNGTGTSAITWLFIAIEFHSTTNPGLSVLQAFNQTAQSNPRNTTRYLPVTGLFTIQTIEEDTQLEVKEAFTIKGINIKLATNTIASASTFALRVNGATSALTVTITSATAGWYEDLAHSVTVAPDDLIDFILITGTGSGSQTMTYRVFGMYIEKAGTVTSVTASEVASKTLVNRFITKV